MSKSQQKKKGKNVPEPNDNEAMGSAPIKQGQQNYQELQEMQYQAPMKQHQPQVLPPMSSGVGINYGQQAIGNGGRGLLDHQEDYDDHGYDESTPKGKKGGKKKNQFNQDLWLLFLLFKGISFLCYFFLPIVFPKALCYIVVLMTTALDFWICKNIVGRKLVKMRWWYIIDQEGNERWHYESRDDQILFQDRLVFWGGLVLHPVAWGLFFVMNAITLDIFRSSITFVCALIGAVQFYGFKQCSNAHARKKKIRSRRQGGGPMRGGRGRGRGGRGRGGMLNEPLDPNSQNMRYRN